MEKLRKELLVSAIGNGTVLDHLPSGNVFDVVRILGLDRLNTQLTVGQNLSSKKYGNKGIIKVSDKFFEAEEIDKIALIAPSTTLIEIRDFEVTEKRNVEIPNEITKFVKCVNPKCITNNQPVPTKFTVVDKKDIKLQCRYCEKYTNIENVEII